MTTEMEKTADPGEILVSSGTRDQLPEGAATTAKGDGWLLKWRKAHCIAPGPLRREGRDPDEVRQWVPLAIRDYLSVGAPEPEHRIATIGFIKFCGFDHLVDSEGPDAASDALDATISSIVSAIDDEEVTFLATDINEDGGKVILAAGAPVAREEDEARILRAFRRIADSNTPLELHFGVNRGHVFTGEVGTEFRSTYTVMGDTVNLAARLMAAAPAGAIYATPNVLDQASTLYSTEALEPFHVKGKEETVHAYEVREELGERSVDDRSEMPFTGRKDELAELVSAITDARDGTGSVVTVIGESGTGKSRLIRQACAEVPDVSVINVRAEPFGATTPYRPFRDPIRAVLGIDRGTQGEMAVAMRDRVAEIDPGLLPMLPLLAEVAHVDVPDTPEASAIEPSFRMDRLADAVAKTLDVALAEPMVINIEDAQWIDKASAHLIAHFTASLDQRPWAIFVSRRGHDDGSLPSEGRAFMLVDLTSGEAEEMIIEATKATPLRPHEIDAIVARGGGNPLFLGEILRVVRESGSIEELPDSLGTVVSAGIDALPPLTRRVLQYCSVFGRSFRVATVQKILAEDGLVLDAATREVLGGFLEEPGEGRLRFRTAMVRDVAYDSLSFRRRQDLHLRAAAAIEEDSVDDSDDAADQLALHYSLGGHHQRTWHYARIAANRAMRSYANIEAAAHYENALDAVRRLTAIGDEERADVWTDLGDVRESAGLFDEALDAYRHASRLVGNDPIAQAELLLKRASTRERAGQYPAALRETTAARRAVEQANSPDAARVNARATAFSASLRLKQERPNDALRAARTAAELAKMADAKDALARAYSVMAWAYLRLDLPGALDLSLRALELYEELGDLVGKTHINNNLGMLAYFDGRWGDALAYYERSRSGSELLGNVVDVAFVEANIGELLVNQFRLDEAESQLQHASRVLRASGELFMAGFAEIQLGRIATGRGDFTGAVDLLNRTREEANEHGFVESALEASLHLADCSIRLGRTEEALTLLVDASSDAGDEASMHISTDARLRATAHAVAGRRDVAMDYITTGLAAALERNLEYEEALSLLLRADLCRLKESNLAAQDYAKAAAILERLEVHSDLAISGVVHI
jgi:class 3 adenylate cyclase/tetratricopeptide (TPR) repeat protein